MLLKFKLSVTDAKIFLYRYGDDWYWRNESLELFERIQGANGLHSSERAAKRKAAIYYKAKFKQGGKYRAKWIKDDDIPIDELKYRSGYLSTKLKERLEKQ